jgi:4,5-DOPA dioxygenase extradiol
MFQEEHPAYLKLQQIGKEITTKVKPHAVVVFSAHWQAEKDTVEVNTGEDMGLIYE